MHLDAEPGSRIVENQAHDFAAEFLMPGAEIADELPQRLDWEASTRSSGGGGDIAQVHRLSRPCTRRVPGVDLQAGDDVARPERRSRACDLGPREAPLLLEKAVRLCEQTGVSFDELVARSGLPSSSPTRSTPRQR